MRMAEGEAAGRPLERVAKMVSRKAVVVFSVTGCCMCYAVKRLLLGMGVGPTVYELARRRQGWRRRRRRDSGCTSPPCSSPRVVALPIDHFASSANSAGVPAVFVGGKLLGGVEEVMSCHINGSLVPLLKQAGIQMPPI